MKLPSSWISSIRYRRTPDGYRYLAIFTHRGETLLWRDKDESSIPSYLPGLIQAGVGGKSVGHAFHVLKGLLEGCEYQRVTEPEKVEELREMMG